MTVQQQQWRAPAAAAAMYAHTVALQVEGSEIVKHGGDSALRGVFDQETIRQSTISQME